MNHTVAKRLVAVAAMVLVPMTTEAQQRSVFAWSNNTNQARTQATVNGSVINTATRGWYQDDGTGRAANYPQNYYTGTDGARQYRSFYIFDLANDLPTITSVSLGLFNCNTGIIDCVGAGTGYNSPNAFETIDIFDYTGSISALDLETGGVAAFNDLGSGVLFGSATVSSANNGQYVNFTLNSAGVAAFNNARGGQIAVGAAMRLTTVPEPSSYALMAAGLAGVFFVARRRRTA